MAVLKAEKITYLFPNGRGTGVSDVSFEAEKGELTVILGSDNSGKTALVKLIGALALPTEGKLTVCGMATDDKKAVRDIRKKCAVIFDRQRERFFTDTPAEELRFALRCSSIPEKDALEAIEKAKAASEITGFDNTNFSLLTEAEIIRSALAVCLVTEPEIIVLDNAGSKFKRTERAELFSLLKKLAAAGIAVILTTTDSEDAVFADRVILMCAGKKTGEGMAREILTDMELLNKSELEPPFAVKIYRDLFDADATLAEIPLTMDELVEEICR